MTTPPVPLRLSSTILILRDAPELEVLMVKRADEVDFASGALVFPGGKVAKGDHAPGWADRIDGAYTGDDRAARIGAIREAFEESGLLLARPASARGAGAAMVGPDIAAALAPQRGAVDRGEVDFLELITQHDLVLALDALVFYAHWLTPTFMPIRFDTHFFLAAAPAGQVAEQDGRETTEAVWITPNAALTAEADGSATIIFPTRLNIKRLSTVQSTPEALSTLEGTDLPSIMPELHQKDGQAWLEIPLVPGYGQTREPVDLARFKAIAKPRT